MAERIVARAEDCVGVLQAVIRDVSEHGANQSRQDLVALIQEVQLRKEHYESWIIQIEPQCSINPLSNTCPLRNPTGQRGMTFPRMIRSVCLRWVFRTSKVLEYLVCLKGLYGEEEKSLGIQLALVTLTYQMML